MMLADFASQFDPVVFDLDGVILDSNGFKLEAMRAALGRYDAAAAEAFLDEFRANFGRTRREHFLAFYNQYLAPDSGFEAFYDEAARDYASRVAERYATAPLCDGAAAFIHGLSQSGHVLYVVSGTMTGEAQTAMEGKGLATAFKAILGGPVRKIDHVRAIRHAQRRSDRPSLLIGDAAEDARVAHECGMHFLFAEKYAIVRARDVIDQLRLAQMHVTATLDPRAQIELQAVPSNANSRVMS